MESKNYISEELDYEKYFLMRHWENWESACLIYQVEPTQLIYDTLFPMPWDTADLDPDNDPLIILRIRDLSEKLRWQPFRDKEKVNPYDCINHALKELIKELPDKLILTLKKILDSFSEHDKKLFIEHYPHIGNFLYPKDNRQKKLLSRIENLEKSLVQKNKEIESLKQDKINLQKSLTETERKTFHKIILGMAIDKYEYKPSENRNTATGEKKGSISFALQKNGLSVSNDSIRSILTNAAELLLES